MKNVPTKGWLGDALGIKPLHKGSTIDPKGLIPTGSTSIAVGRVSRRIISGMGPVSDSINASS